MIFSGAFVALLPFLGFPNSWDTVLLFLAGILVVALGIVARRRRGAEETMQRRASTFAESMPPERQGISTRRVSFARHDREEMGSE